MCSRRHVLALTVVMALALLLPVRELQAATDMETLNRYMAELNKKPDAQELRKKIITFVQSMKTAPSTPEDADRALARGNTLLKMATDKAGYEKAIPEFQEATTLAPWLGEAYLGLSTAQEKAGYFSDAINSLNNYLLINPKGGGKDIKKKIYELEVYAEQAHQIVPHKVPATSTTAKKQDSPPEKAGKKANPEAFVGSWYTAEKSGPKEEEVFIHAFTIRRDTGGALIATPPRRSTGTVGAITAFEISGRNVKLQITWKLASVPSYWKTEDFVLTLSDDDSKLVGRYDQKSSGARSREFSDDKKIFTRQ